MSNGSLDVQEVAAKVFFGGGIDVFDPLGLELFDVEAVFAPADAATRVDQKTKRRKMPVDHVRRQLLFLPHPCHVLFDERARFEVGQGDELGDDLRNLGLPHAEVFSEVPSGGLVAGTRFFAESIPRGIESSFCPSLPF